LRCVAAVVVFTAGLHAIRAQLPGYYPEDSGLGEENWGTTAPGLLWPIWGAALGAAALWLKFLEAYEGALATVHADLRLAAAA